MNRRHENMQIDGRALMAAYGGWMEELEAQGFLPYLLTFMFSHIRGSALTVERVMREEVERVYGLSLTHFVRRPHSAAQRDLLPRWIGCPDYPVGKGAGGSFRDVSVNAGRHVHVLAMIFRVSRLTVPFHLHIREQSELYERGPLRRLDAEPVRDRLAYVGEYGLKQIGRGRATSDDLIILPRSSSEMARRRAWAARDAC